MITRKRSEGAEWTPAGDYKLIIHQGLVFIFDDQFCDGSRSERSPILKRRGFTK